MRSKLLAATLILAAFLCGVFFDRAVLLAAGLDNTPQVVMDKVEYGYTVYR